jgi:hypothetical protein
MRLREIQKVRNAHMPSGRIAALCVETWLRFAIRRARVSGVISYPYLYRNSAASDRALVTCARASATTQ